MPVVYVYDEHDVKVDIELDENNSALGGTVHYFDGVRKYDATDAEFYRLLSDNQPSVLDQLEQHNRDAKQQNRYDLAKFRDDGCYQAGEY